MQVSPKSVTAPKPMALRLAFAAGVAAVWAVGGVPPLFGRSRCVAAALFHVPCPGCGMTRAARLLWAGDVLGSLRMHPLMVPAVAATASLALATVRLAYEEGSLMRLWSDRLARASLIGFAGVYGAVVVLWILRCAGLFGGPVPV
jgi:Protein of unknown function (DUF2752)